MPERPVGNAPLAQPPEQRPVKSDNRSCISGKIVAKILFVTIQEMIRILRLELDRVDRCLLALESLAGPRRGRPRKTPLSIGKLSNSRPAKNSTEPKARRNAAGE